MAGIEIDIQKQAERFKNINEKRIYHREFFPLWLRLRLFPLGIFVLALSLNLYRLGSPGIWFDEAFSVELARQPLPLLLRLIFGPEPNMELYYLFLHFWLRFTGFLGFDPIEVVVRFPSAIFAALGAVIVFALGRRFLTTFAGLFAALLYLVNDAQLIYAQQVRSYSLQLMLICLSWYALLCALTSAHRRSYWWAGYVLSTVLAMYAHLFSLLIVVAQVGVVAGLMALPGQWRPQTRSRVAPILVSLTCIGVFSLPMLSVSLQGPQTGWLAKPGLHDVLSVFYSFVGYQKVYLLALLSGCALCVIALVVSNLTKIQVSWAKEMIQGFRPLFSVGWCVLGWSTIPLILSYLLSQGEMRLFSARYLVVIVPALCLLPGVLVAGLRKRLMQIVVVASMLALALSSVPYYYASAQVEDWNSTVHWMQERYSQGDGLVCYDNTIAGPVKQGCQISVEYYLHAYPGIATFSADSPGLFSWETFSAPDPEAALDPLSLTKYAANHSHFFWIVGRIQAGKEGDVRTAQVWLDGRYNLLGEISTRTVAIRWYATSYSDCQRC
jgi:uncharacterized membrane protein